MDRTISVRRPERSTRRSTRTARALLLGGALGALGAYIFDARSGRRRRALARDRAAAFVRRGTRRTARRLRTTGAYGAGWSRGLLHLREQPKDHDDVTLAQKVQSEIFRSADAPKATVNVNVVDGVVQLRGEIREPAMIDELIEKTRRVQGVRDVESFLHLPSTPAPMGR